MTYGVYHRADLAKKGYKREVNLKLTKAPMQLSQLVAINELWTRLINLFYTNETNISKLYPSRVKCHIDSAFYDSN